MRKLLPPDDGQVGIAREVNAGLEQGLRVTFYRVQDQEAEPVSYGMLWQYGPARRLKEQSDAFFDVDRIGRDIRAWKLNVERRRERYTTIPYEEQTDGEVGR
jgi:hypothetical protein